MRYRVLTIKLLTNLRDWYYMTRTDICLGVMCNAGRVGRGARDVQRGSGGANDVEPECEHLQGPAVGPRAGDPRRGPHRCRAVRSRVRARPPAALRRFPRAQPAQAGRLLQALHRLRPRQLEGPQSLPVQRHSMSLLRSKSI